MEIKRSIPISRQIADKLREDIFCTFRPGEELPGDNELSRQLDVSPLVVREAMSVLREEGLVERKVGSGTRVVVPRIGKHQVIAVLIDKDLTHPCFPMHFLPLFEHIRKTFAKAGMRAQLYTGSAEPNVFLEKISSSDLWIDLQTGRIAAVVSLLGYPEEKYLDYAAGHFIPWVYFGRTGNAPIKIRSDMEGILYALIGEFARQGKQRVGLLGWQGFWDTNLRNTERRQWFAEALRQNGMSTREEWIRMDLYPGLTGAGWSQIRTLWTAGVEKPDAVVFLDDLLFLDAMPALMRLGINIPDDLAIGVMTHRSKQLSLQVPAVIADICPLQLSKAVLSHVKAALERGIISPVEETISANILVFGENGAKKSHLEKTIQMH